MASPPRNRGLIARLLGLCTRLLVWYTIITLAFRCPSTTSELTDANSIICKPAIQIKEFALPYAKPYYDRYAGPYVEKAQPYVDRFNEKVYYPVSSAGLGAYAKYGAPRVAQVTQLSEKEYNRLVKPVIDEWSRKAGTRYQASVGPYVDRAQSVVYPYVEAVGKGASDQYEKVLLPTYERSLPYARLGYDRGQRYIFDYALPYSQYAFDSSIILVTRRIWPPIRVIYGQNVEPQLWKIKERLASYRDGKKIEAVVSSMEASYTSEEAEATETVSTTTFTSSDVETSSTTTITTSNTASSESSEPISVTEDLKRWQVKFAAASDRGAEDLSSRVEEMANNHLEYQVDGTGAALVTQLEEAARTAQHSLRDSILSTVSDLPEDATDEDQTTAYSTLRTTIRSHGNTIKDKAQNLRLWKLQSNDELTSLLNDASEGTLSVLDGIRDLSLQEIGMRWAASEHVTYQDWAEYHKLKQSFHDWRETVASVVTNSERVKEIRQAAEDLEDKGMGIAQEAAEELSRLKNVARWKIHARDSSDDFATRTLPAAAARIGQKIMSAASSAVGASSSPESKQGMADSIISAATSSAASAASQASESLSSYADASAYMSSNHPGASDIAPETDTEASSSSLLSDISASASSAMGSATSYLDTDTLTEETTSTILHTPSVTLNPSAASSIASSLASNAKSVTRQVGASGSSYSAAATEAAGSVAAKASSRAAAQAAKAAEGLQDMKDWSADNVVDADQVWADYVAGGAVDDDGDDDRQGSVQEEVDAIPDIERMETEVDGAEDANGDTVDYAASASASIKSMVSEAGEAASTVTQTLRSRASEVVDQ